MRLSAFFNRIQKVLELVKEQRIDCMLVTPSTDMKYLCGYSIGGDERFLALVLSPGHEPFIFANILYELQVTETPIKDFIYWEDGENPFALLRSELYSRGISLAKVAVNSSMPALFTISILDTFSGISLINGSKLIQPLRMYKDKYEIELMLQATAKADTALSTCIGKGRYWLGKTEKEFLAELTAELAHLGIENAGGCVAVGKNAAIPHHHTGNAVIESGKCLLVDFGGTFKNYNTDMTRTFHFGEPCKKFHEVYETVREANSAGEAVARLGNQLQDIDIAARGVIERAGYGSYFIHRTGHGIGLDCHEGPSAGFGETTEIKPGMAFSCEPGIYLPGEFGVRIEDQVVINTDGATCILHHFSKELMIIK